MIAGLFVCDHIQAKYKDQYGDTRVPQNFDTPDFPKLGAWVNRQ